MFDLRRAKLKTNTLSQQENADAATKEQLLREMNQAIVMALGVVQIVRTAYAKKEDKPKDQLRLAVKNLRVAGKSLDTLYRTVPVRQPEERLIYTIDRSIKTAIGSFQASIEIDDELGGVRLLNAEDVLVLAKSRLKSLAKRLNAGVS